MGPLFSCNFFGILNNGKFYLASDDMFAVVIYRGVFRLFDISKLNSDG